MLTWVSSSAKRGQPTDVTREPLPAGSAPQMKMPLLPCLAIVFGTVLIASGQMPVSPSHPHSLSLQVEPLSTGNTTSDTEGTKDHRIGSGGASNKKEAMMHSAQTQTSRSSAAIEISVRNFGALPDTAQVEWYFLAEPAHLDTGKSASDQTYVFDKGSQSVSLAANGMAKIPVTSKEVTAETTRKGGMRTGGRQHMHDGGEKETGDVLSGWIVRVVSGGRVIDAKGSKQEMDDLARDSRLGSAVKP